MSSVCLFRVKVIVENKIIIPPPEWPLFLIKNLFEKNATMHPSKGHTKKGGGVFLRFYTLFSNFWAEF